MAAFGQPNIFPGQVKIGAAVGSTSPVTEVVNLYASGPGGQFLAFDVSIQYGNGPQGWLSATPLQGSTPAKITISADPTNLPAGNYNARVIASVGPQHAAAVATVSFIVAPSSSNPGGVSANPASLTFFAPSLTAQTISVSNAPGGSGAQQFSIFANPSDSLSISQSDQATPATITVQPLPGSSYGPHNGSVTITALATGKSTVVPVTLYVPDNGMGPTVTLTPSQKSLVFNYQFNTASNPQQTVFVSTDSTQSANFTAAASASWIGVAASSLVTPSSSATSVAPGLVYVSIDPVGLGAGVYKGSVTLSSPGVTSVDIPVTLTVTASPVLNANPSFLTLDARANTLVANLAVTASSSMTFTSSVSAPWLTVLSSSGQASGDPASVTVYANLTGLSAGTYNGSITISGPGGNPSLTIPVQLNANGGSTSSAPLLVSPASLSFVGISGIDILPRYLVVNSASNAAEQFTLAAASDSGWLSVDRPSGKTPMNVTVSVNSGLAAGSYTGSITATSLQTGSTTTVSVTYQVAARVLSALPAALTFVQQDVGTVLAPQSVKIGANAPSTFHIVRQPTWAKVSAPSTWSTPATLTVSVDTTGLTPGPYQDSIQLSGPSDISIPVVLSIAAPAPPAVTPANITFNYELGGAPPPAQTIRIMNPTGPVAFTAVASTFNGAKWLAVDTAAGMTPGTIAVSLNVAQLVPGQQPGSVSINLQDSAGTSLRVPVILTVTGSALQVKDVLNNATGLPASVAPGEIVTLTGRGFGPLAPVSAQPSTAGAYGTAMAGVSVLFDGTPAPLLMVSGDQINAIVPYSVAGRATTKLQVQSGSSYSVPIEIKVADAAPGVFTTGGSGRGQALALNADSTANSTLNPAPRGTAMVFYLTGEGQTDPPGQDGRIIATDLRKPLLPVTATIGGLPAQVQYAGSATSLVSGMCQVNVLLPDTLDPGTQTVEIQVGGIPSQRGVTVEVK